MISKLLSTAVKLYLRSQVDRAENLQVKVVGRNKQILTGYIPQVFLSCSRTVYQGLYLSQVELEGADIAFNLPEVLKKKPLKLLEPVFVDIRLKLGAVDLQASVNSPLLQSGLSDLWRTISTAQTDTAAKELTDTTIEWQNMAIADEKLHLTGSYRDTSSKIQKLDLSTGISLADSHTLYLSPLKIANVPVTDNQEHGLKIDLGTDVAIEKLSIESEQILCSGKIKINN